jgi:hypothetical protein
MTNTLISFWSRGRRMDRGAYIVGTSLLVSGLIHLAILVISGASWAGPLSLRKPTTFGLSFGLTLISIAWVASFLRLSERARAVLLGAFTVACALETALVTLQAWRGVPSHFDLETPFDAMVARTLAAGGFALVAIIIVMTLAAFRTNPTVPISLQIAVQIGFVALVGAMLVGAIMIAKGMMLVFAGDPQAAYRIGGALKPTHAVFMHGIFVLPALAWLLSFASCSERRRLVAVLVASASYIVLAGAIAFRNIAALAFEERPDVLALVAVGAFVVLATGFVAVNAIGRAPINGGIQHPLGAPRY